MLLNAKIVGNRSIWEEFAVFKVLNVPNAMGRILLITIVTLHGVVKLMINLTLLNLKPRRANHAHTHSSLLIVRVLMVLTLLNTFSGNTISTRSGTPKNMLNSGKLGGYQSIQA